MQSIIGAGQKTILDACCGGRMFWFDKADSRATFLDNRQCSVQLDARPGRSPYVVAPDTIGDFTALPYRNETFWLVVFDPPHTVTNSSAGWKRTKYGHLSIGWRDMLRLGFAECFRVLRHNGTLVFKWAESSVSVGEVLKLAQAKPAFGQRLGAQAKTHWICFFKERPAQNTMEICHTAPNSGKPK